MHLLQKHPQGGVAVFKFRGMQFRLDLGTVPFGNIQVGPYETADGTVFIIKQLSG